MIRFLSVWAEIVDMISHRCKDRDFLTMNFDGTYPGSEKESLGKLLECEKSEAVKKPPVRVVVSYPQSEEWDGTTGNRHYKKWIISGVSVVLLAAAIAAGLYYFYKFQDTTAPVDDIVVAIEYDRPDDEDLKRYLIQQVKEYYEHNRKTFNRTMQLEFFCEEQIRLETQPLSEFLNGLDLSMPLVLPQNKEAQLDIADAILGNIQISKAWLTFIIHEEERLASYHFQINRKENKWAFDEHKTSHWSASENHEVHALREAYTKPLEVTKTGHSVHIYGQVIVFKEIVNILDAFAENVTQVTLISSILYLDANMTRNIDLAIFSSNWTFINPVLFDLSGADATDDTLDVKDGRPGIAGADGGFFLAAGNVDMTKLTVLNDGGNGGAGHMGPDGRNGTPNLRPDVYSGKPRCAIPEGSAERNPAGEELRKYLIYHNDSCGEVGGAGGSGGAPGRGGTAVYFLPDEYSVRIGKDGIPGFDGVKGKNGKSAPGVCYYLAYRTRPLGMGYRLTDKWSPITNVRCGPPIPLPMVPNSNDQSYSMISSVRKPPRNMTVFQEGIMAFSLRTRSLFEHGKDQSMFAVLKTMENSLIIGNTTTVPALFDEFKTIDEKFTRPEILDSFLEKLRQMLKVNSHGEKKIALEYLQVAVWSKASVLRTGFGDYYIVDIGRYIDHVLQTVEHLDVDVLKVPSYSNQNSIEISEKLTEMKRTIRRISPNVVQEGTDKRLTTLTSTILKALPHLVDITNQVLTNTSSVDMRHFQALNKTIEDYRNLKRTYYLGAVSKVSLIMDIHLEGNISGLTDSALQQNRTISEPIFACAEMMNVAENCSNNKEVLEKWEMFRAMDQHVIDGFQKIGQENPLNGMAQALKVVLRYVRETYAKSATGRIRVTDLRSVTQDFSALLTRCRRAADDADLQRTIATLSGEATLNDVVLARSVADTKRRILNRLLQNQYQRALYAYQQWAYPYVGTVSKVSYGTQKEELILAIRAIKDALSTYHTTIQERDTQIKEAEFHLTTSIGPFYTWRNVEHREAIAQLLRGQRVRMRASLADCPHTPLKQAIKFRTAELRFSVIPKKILQNFAIEMTHSGFSHFLHNGTTYTAVGPQVSLYYSFDVGNNDDHPTVFNQVYKKIKNGDITLSPFTTWTIQLQQVNSKAQYQDLRRYVNTTDVHLVGDGWYTSSRKKF